jgi:hypothetical protein
VIFIIIIITLGFLKVYILWWLGYLHMHIVAERTTS